MNEIKLAKKLLGIDPSKQFDHLDDVINYARLNCQIGFCRKSNGKLWIEQVTQPSIDLEKLIVRLKEILNPNSSGLCLTPEQLIDIEISKK